MVAPENDPFISCPETAPPISRTALFDILNDPVLPPLELVQWVVMLDAGGCVVLVDKGRPTKNSPSCEVVELDSGADVGVDVVDVLASALIVD
jgi:hypothetical protein